MKNYSNQIHKIKHTLVEIKNNIEKIQLVNKYLNNNILIKFQSNTKEKQETIPKKVFNKKQISFIKKRNNLYEKNKKDIKNKEFKTQKINNKIDFNKYFNDNSLINKKMISTPFLYNKEETYDKIDNDNVIINYQLEKIEKEIDIIKSKNESSLKQLKEAKEKNISLITLNSNKDIENNLQEISKYFEVNNIEGIPPKLKEMMDYINNNKENNMEKEFIQNLKEIYIKENNIKENNMDNNITTKLIWRWIKYLLNKNKKIKNDINNNNILLQNIKKENNLYKSLCEEIMNTYDFNILNQFDEFILCLINKNNVNRKRIDQLKKILEEDNNKNKNKYKMNDIK